MPKHKEPTHTEVLVSGIDGMRSGASIEHQPGTLFVGLNIRRNDGDAAGDLIYGAASVMDVREATGFLRHLITTESGKARLMTMAREYETANAKA